METAALALSCVTNVSSFGDAWYITHGRFKIHIHTDITNRPNINIANKEKSNLKHSHSIMSVAVMIMRAAIKTVGAF